jgi:hypothetical protein
LYVFDGYVMKNSDRSKQPLDSNNLLLRGSTLRKTPWAIGVAVNVGNEAKIMQNMTKVPRKVTQLERHMNVLVLLQFGVLLALSAIMAGLDNWWQLRHPAGERYWYLLSIERYPELPPGVANFFVMVGACVCNGGRRVRSMVQGLHDARTPVSIRVPCWSGYTICKGSSRSKYTESKEVEICYTRL